MCSLSSWEKASCPSAGWNWQRDMLGQWQTHQLWSPWDELALVSRPSFQQHLAIQKAASQLGDIWKTLGEFGTCWCWVPPPESWFCWSGTPWWQDFQSSPIGVMSSLGDQCFNTMGLVANSQFNSPSSSLWINHPTSLCPPSQEFKFFSSWLPILLKTV